MGAPRCKICGKILDFEDWYAVKVGGTTRYYCSEEEYNRYNTETTKAENDQKERKKIETTLKQSIINEICIIINDIEIVTTTNSTFDKELKLWRTITDDQTILKYLTDKELELSQIITRLGSTASQFSKIRYLSKVIQNNLGDYLSELHAIQLRKEEYEKQNNGQKDENFVLHRNTKRRENRRKGFSELD